VTSPDGETTRGALRDFDFDEPQVEGAKAVIAFAVPADLAYLEGHFPGAPIVPGVAQVVALAERQARRVWPDLGAAAGLRRVKFKKALYPGDRLELHLERSDDRVTFTIEGPDAERYTQGALLVK